MIILGVILLVISIVLLLSIALRVARAKNQSEDVQRQIMQRAVNINYAAILLAVIGFASLTIGLIFR